MNRRSGGMAEQLAKRDARCPLPVRWNAPGTQILLDVAIQRDPPLFNQPHRGQRKDWLAHRSGLEQGTRIHRIRLAARADAEFHAPTRRDRRRRQRCSLPALQSVPSVRRASTRPSYDEPGSSSGANQQPAAPLDQQGSRALRQAFLLGQALSRVPTRAGRSPAPRTSAPVQASASGSPARSGSRHSSHPHADGRTARCTACRSPAPR